MRLEISALSCHGNPLHLDKDIARAHAEDFRDAVRLTAELGVERVVTFSGCLGDFDGSKRPNWVTGCCTVAAHEPCEHRGVVRFRVRLLAQRGKGARAPHRGSQKRRGEERQLSLASASRRASDAER